MENNKKRSNQGTKKKNNGCNATGKCGHVKRAKNKGDKTVVPVTKPEQLTLLEKIRRFFGLSR